MREGGREGACLPACLPACMPACPACLSVCLSPPPLSLSLLSVLPPPLLSLSLRVSMCARECVFSVCLCQTEYHNYSPEQNLWQVVSSCCVMFLSVDLSFLPCPVIENVFNFISILTLWVDAPATFICLQIYFFGFRVFSSAVLDICLLVCLLFSFLR